MRPTVRARSMKVVHDNVLRLSAQQRVKSHVKRNTAGQRTITRKQDINAYFSEVIADVTRILPGNHNLPPLIQIEQELQKILRIVDRMQEAQEE